MGHARTSLLLLALLALPARAADDVLETFEGYGDAAAWRPADWAEATRDGGPYAITQGPQGATEGAYALQVALRFDGQGYAQGYAGRPARLSLRDAAALALDVTLPPDAPAGLAAKVILLVGPGDRVVGIEVKGSATVTAADARHLATFRDRVGDRFVHGYVLYLGARPIPLGEC